MMPDVTFSKRESSGRCGVVRRDDFGFYFGRDDEFIPGEPAEQLESVDVDQVDEHVGVGHHGR